MGSDDDGSNWNTMKSSSLLNFKTAINSFDKMMEMVI